MKEQKKILITGASRGIGRAIALQLAKSGDYSLVLHASSHESLQPLKSALPGSCNYDVMPCDFNDMAAVAAFVANVKRQHPDIFGIISNAGIVRDKALAYQPIKEIDELLNINLKVPVLLAKAAMKLFSKNGTGVFITLSSCVAETGNAFQSVYAATKAANEALCKSLARESGLLQPGMDIRFLSVAPGFIETEMTAKIPEEIRTTYLKQIPSGRLGKAEEVAQTIQFLLSEQASYLNGGTFKINGGLA